MAEAEIMAEEMQSPKKVAFAQRKYTNEEKRKIEELLLSLYPLHRMTCCMVQGQ